MSSEDLTKIIKEEIARNEKEWKEVHHPNIEKARMSIKHPHFKFARYNLTTREITYHWKKFYLWLSGKRVVEVRTKIEKFKTSGLSRY